MKAYKYKNLWGPATLLKRDSNTGVFLWNLWNFKNIDFEEHVLLLLIAMVALEFDAWLNLKKRKSWKVKIDLSKLKLILNFL